MTLGSFLIKTGPTEECSVSRLAISLLIALPLGLLAPAQTPIVKKVPARYTSPASGPEMYHAYCASCHGTDGLGNGPVAQHLKLAVPNLTLLAREHQGTFPTAQVEQVIRGEVGVKSHGVKDMPVWGPFFLSLDHSQEPVVRIRVANLIRHLEQLQAK